MLGCILNTPLQRWLAPELMQGHRATPASGGEMDAVGPWLGMAWHGMA